jgi:peptidoglycan/xylan/chitin deacetylase (PgdA/CDA1 family)
MAFIALEYHDVIGETLADDSGFPGAAANSYKLDPSSFASHLDAVAASGARVLAADTNAVERSPRENIVFLTFDDGGVSALDVIAPALERRGWVGHFFIATDCIGKRGFLGADHLRALVRRGHVVGSHSRSHPLRMSSLSPAQLDDEWGASMATLRDVLGVTPVVASVPGGALSAAVIDHAAAAGIRILFTSEPTTRVMVRGECTVLGRYTLRRAHGGRVAASLLAPSPTARVSQWLAWNGKKVAKRLGGNAYLRVRASLFRGR